MKRDSWILGGAYGGLLPLVALLCGWFGVHTRSFAAALEATLDEETRPGVFSVGQIAWGPHPFEITAYDVVMRDRAGQPLIRAGRVHARLDGDLRIEDHNLRLRATAVEVDDFELTLRWDKLGDLTLVEPFGSKTFGLARDKAPPSFVSLDLPEIALRRGTLHLVFGDGSFGFSFRGIDTAGAVHVHDEDLDIRVAALDAADSTTWVRRAPAPLAARLAAALPPNAVSPSAPGGLRVPFGDVRIRDFVWAGDGFRAGVDLVGSDGTRVHVAGLMDFPSEGTVHQVEATLDVPGGTVEALTGGHASGDTSLSLATDGIDLATRLSIGPVTLGSLRLGQLALDRATLGGLELDTRQEEGRVSFRCQLDAARFGDDVQVETVDVSAAASIGWPDWRVGSFLRDVAADPITAALPLLTNDGAEATVDASVGSARLERGGERWKDVVVEALRLRAGSGSVAGRVLRASAEGQGTVAAELATSFELSLSGPSGEITVAITFRAVPIALARRLLPNEAQLTAHAGPLVSGRVTLTAPITNPKGLHVSSVVLEPGP